MTGSYQPAVSVDEGDRRHGGWMDTHQYGQSLGKPVFQNGLAQLSGLKMFFPLFYDGIDVLGIAVA